MSNDPNFKKFEALLDAHMAAAGLLKDRALSLAAGVSEDYVSKLRRRKNIPKVDFLAKLAKPLGVEPTALMPGARIPSIPLAPKPSPKQPQRPARTVDIQDLKTAIYSASLIYCGQAGLSERELHNFAEHVAAVYAHLIDSILEKTG
jgi:transcriptional regulator with XRE-family HTH domain